MAGDRKLGYAVVGLGHIAQTEVLPAFAHANGARLVALVSGEASKREELGRRYGVQHLYGYDGYDACLANPEVDAVYIALPNDMHCEYTVRAARAGVHVLCEKPMALDEDECREMIRACDDASVKLMIAYRLHFEPGNLEAIAQIRRGAIGDPRFFSSQFGYQVQRGNIRTSSERGGGPLWDLGPYCINATRYLFGDEPEEVFARTTTGRGDERFGGVEESATAVLRFPNERLATFTVSYNCGALATYRVVGTEGDLAMDDAYEYAAPRRMRINREGEVSEREFPVVDQFAPQLEHFAACVAHDREPEPSGEEGLADVRIVRAIFRSAAEGGPVRLEPFQRSRRPSPDQARSMPPHGEPPTVHVEAPSAD
jgi:predicted dehydrogenase